MQLCQWRLFYPTEIIIIFIKNINCLKFNYSQPLPPLPTEIKNMPVCNRSSNKPFQSLSKLPVDLPNSNRCSSSSGASSTGVYGHLSHEVSEDESPYDKPCLRGSNSIQDGTRVFRRPKSTGSETKVKTYD